MARRRKGTPIHGWLILDKPLGPSSSGCVGKLKWLTGAQKVGHGGTLDPLASGVLPIAFGEATKTSSYAMDGSKTYEFDVTWGTSTETCDAEGDVIASSDARPTEEQINAALPSFIGDIDQIPPKFSAIKIDGQRAYELARKGEEVDIKSRPVTIHDLRVVRIVDSNTASFEVDCGKGTYVRSLARDLALHLGCEGHISRLRRTAVGPFLLKRPYRWQLSKRTKAKTRRRF